ncbi:hypothetical protein Pelo_16209 [Pelomyxa schiedti]|nr:hypothetical protein Pelo_16209 [Pelomyxa schiedti]
MDEGTLVLVFQYLTSRELLSASHVCRLWRRSASQDFLWRDLSLRTWVWGCASIKQSLVKLPLPPPFIVSQASTSPTSPSASAVASATPAASSAATATANGKATATAASATPGSTESNSIVGAGTWRGYYWTRIESEAGGWGMVMKGLGGGAQPESVLDAWPLASQPGPSIASVEVGYEKSGGNMFRVVLAGESNGKVVVWNPTAQEKLIRKWDAHSALVSQIQYTPTGLILTSSFDGTLKVWKDFSESCVLRGHASSVKCLDYMENTSSIISSGDDCTVKTWDMETGVCTSSARKHRKSVFAISYYNENTFLTASDDSNILMWDSRCNAASGVKQPTIQGDVAVAGIHTNTALSLQCLPGWYQFLSSGAEERSFLWDLRMLQSQLASWETTGPIWTIKTDGKHVFGGGRTVGVQCWSMSHPSGLIEGCTLVPDFGSIVRSVCVNHNWLVFGGLNGTLGVVSPKPTKRPTNGMCSVC